MSSSPTTSPSIRTSKAKALDPNAFPVYKAVRISASFPYFFPPVRGLWDRSTTKEGVFVDGGVASSFPLFVFDKPNPQHPTWGFHLHGGLDAMDNQPTASRHRRRDVAKGDARRHPRHRHERARQVRATAVRIPRDTDPAARSRR